MAQRNRALEDLVYDFDAENRAMEFELEDLRRTNAQLQGRLQELQRQSARVERSPSDRSPSSPSSETMRRESDRAEPKNKSASPSPLKLPSGRGKDESSSSTPEPLKLEAPEIIVPKKSTEAADLPQAEPILPAPEPLKKESLLPKEPNKDLLPQSSDPILPPTAKESILKSAPSGLPTGAADSSSQERKIQLPSGGLPTNAQSPVIQTSATQATNKPIDPRVRQIDWHPSLCRAQNSDGKPGDDGLYLVLVPRNSAGEFVPTTGSMTIVIEETQADGSISRIGRYEFTAEELKEHLEPIGSAPGIHLPVRWKDQTPSTTSVEAYVKFTLDDGTTMVNRRSFPLRKLASGGPSSWTPR